MKLGIQNARGSNRQRSSSMNKIPLFHQESSQILNMHKWNSINLDDFGVPKENKNNLISGKILKLRKLESQRYEGLHFLKDEFTFEESKITKANEPDTNDSTPHKSVDETDEIFESFTVPSIDEFQLDFRKKVLLELIKTDHHTMRNKFLNKLAQNKIWLLPQEKPVTHQTTIIFDWDDTLLWTTYLNPNGYYWDEPVPLSAVEMLIKLEDVVWKILEQWMKYGKVYIITNAAEGWVQFSSEKYMPKVSKLINKVTVISARSNYEHKFPLNSTEWKMHAFKDTIKDHEISAVTNLLAIGDSNIEMEASKHMSKWFPLALLKTIKFKEQPTPEELVKQLTLVTERLESIWSSAKNLTIRLERRPKGQPESGDVSDKQNA